MSCGDTRRKTQQLEEKVQDPRPDPEPGGWTQLPEPMSLRRRSSSRQMLQNLIRVTAQRSQEDAEEAERERRRRARGRRRDEDGPSRSEAPRRSELTHDSEFHGDVKPSSFMVLEEDEGFSDWSHRLENRHEQEVPDKCRAKERRPSAPQRKPEPEEEKQEEEGQEASQRPKEKTSGIRREARSSFSSSVFLPQDSRHPADRTSYLAAGTMKPGSQTSDPMDGEEEQEKKEEMEQPADKDDPGGERQSFTHEQKEDVCLSREARSQGGLNATSSVQNGGGRTEGKASAAPVLGSEGHEPLNCYGPMSPTFKKLLIQFYPDEVNSRVSTEKCTIVERTESLRRSTSSSKKTPPPVAVAKIDKKLEQYTQALEVSSKEGRSGCQALADLGPAEPVASKKNLFEARDVWNQSPISPLKDADGVKVAVADLINQRVRGSEDGSSSASKPADSSTTKKYKFVVTGHGKYEKVSAGGGQAAGLFCGDL